ncbi:MAG: hypothetical protein Q9227_009579, partial [Pyrenula ochraceoflavens]
LANSLFDPSTYNPQDVIKRDVAVVGGGSAGVYAAVRLQDYNKSIVIIERNDYLGGHAETYIDPQTGVPINLGVVGFPRTQVTEEYFARFNIPLTAYGSSFPPRSYVDFSTGKIIDYKSIAAADIAAAFQGYAVQLQKYPGLQTGFNLTYPVSSDLLLPFGDFLNKYNISALIPRSFYINQGYSPFLNISTLYMFKYLNAHTLNTIANGSLTPASHNAGDLYSAALSHFGPSTALLNTTIVAMDRSTSPIKLVIETTTDTTTYSSTQPHRRLILAKKLLSTPPPTPSQLLPAYDLNPHELSLFTQFFSNGYYSAVLNNTGLPSHNQTYISVDPSTPYSIPPLPGLYTLDPVGGPNSSLFQAFYGSPHPLPDAQVQSDIISSVKRLAAAAAQVQQTPDANPNPSEAEIVAYTAHQPFNLMVSNAAIEDGFYEKLYALQGKENTFWSGAAWMAQDSEAIWEFTERWVVKGLVAALE